MIHKFRSRLAATAVVFACMAGAGAAAAQTYLPSGPQTAVPVTTVTDGGWQECFRDTYAGSGVSLATILTACGGSARLMMACRVTGSPTLQVLAQGPTAGVTTVTTGANVTTTDGSGFYYSTNRSWGFARAGDPIGLAPCDVDNTGPGAGSDRICWHTVGSNLANGYRCGSDVSNTAAFERIIYRVTPVPAPVPTLAEWSMILLGMLLAAGAAVMIQRRRSAA